MISRRQTTVGNQQRYLPNHLSCYKLLFYCYVIHSIVADCVMSQLLIYLFYLLLLLLNSWWHNICQSNSILTGYGSQWQKDIVNKLRRKEARDDWSSLRWCGTPFHTREMELLKARLVNTVFEWFNWTRLILNGQWSHKRTDYSAVQVYSTAFLIVIFPHTELEANEVNSELRWCW